MKVQCFDCGEEFDIPAKPGDVKKWQSGMLIQFAMPYLTPGQRELLISNTCDNCFEATMAEYEEEYAGDMVP